MAGINQGQPEVAVGEPIRFGDIDGFELEQHPVSDRLIIRDTANGTVAYVRAERGGQIGGDGVLIKALKESKPMADTGRTYDTIQEAEREASSWVFVPPGTFNESITIETDGLTLQGSGYNTLVDGGTSNSITSSANDIEINNLSVTSDGGVGISVGEALVKNVYFSGNSRNMNIKTGSVLNCIFESSDDAAINDDSNIGEFIISGNIFKSSIDDHAIILRSDNSIVSNNVINQGGANGNGVYLLQGADSNIVIGNRISNAPETGIDILGSATDNIIANNRVSDSGQPDIDDGGTGTLLDGNLTGLSN